LRYRAHRRRRTPRRVCCSLFKKHKAQERDTHIQRKCLRHVGFILAVRGGHDLGNGVLVREEVDNIEEALEVAVLEVLANRNEKDRDTGGDADGVLDVEVLDPIF
jgi:hypothetical protein